MRERQNGAPWWGEVELGLDEVARWEIGPLRLWLQRSASEWRLANEWGDNDDAVGWSLVRDAVWPGEDLKCERFAVTETGSRVQLRPLPADRPVVARPRTPFRVLPAQQSRVFMSAPLWIEIRVGSGGLALREISTKRLSDTWFGATTRDGELCYALKTHARTRLEEMPRAAHRLLTPVVIENRSTEPLVVERLNLPAPFLSVYGGAAGGAWSEEVHMVWSENGDLAELDLRDGPPLEAEGGTRLSAPRQIAAKGHLFRAFGSLLGLDF
jgi:hypothetical protein